MRFNLGLGVVQYVWYSQRPSVFNAPSACHRQVLSGAMFRMPCKVPPCNLGTLGTVGCYVQTAALPLQPGAVRWGQNPYIQIQKGLRSFLGGAETLGERMKD